MSIHISSKAWKTPCPDPISKLVLLKLADHSNDDGVCWPSIAKIISDTGAGKSTILKKIADFEAMGWLTRQRGEKTIYILTIPEPDEVVPHRDFPQSKSRTETDGPAQRLDQSRTETSVYKEPSMNRQRTDKALFSKKPKKEHKTSAEKRPHEAITDWPESWQTDIAFPKAWADYLQVRCELRKPSTATVVKLLRKKLLAYPVEIATNSLRASAESGWTGVFPEKLIGIPPKQKPGSSEPALDLGW